MKAQDNSPLQMGRSTARSAKVRCCFWKRVGASAEEPPRLRRGPSEASTQASLKEDSGV